MDYAATDRAALTSANRELRVGRWYGYWVGVKRMRVELCAFDIVLEEHTYATEAECRGAFAGRM